MKDSYNLNDIEWAFASALAEFADTSEIPFDASDAAHVATYAGEALELTNEELAEFVNAVEAGFEEQMDEIQELEEEEDEEEENEE